MITVETMITRLERRRPRARRHVRLHLDRLPDADRHPRHRGGVRADRLRPEFSREYTFSIFAVVAIALIASWIVAVVFSPLLGVAILKKPKHAHEAEPGPILRAFRGVLVAAMRARWLTILVTLALFGVALYGMRFVPQQFFPASDRPELLVDLKLPQNGSIYASRDVSARLDDLLKVTRTWSAGAPMWAGGGPVLPAARPAAPERLLFPGRDRDEGPGTAGARQGPAGAGACDRVPERRRSGLSPGTGTAGRLAAAVQGERA